MLAATAAGTFGPSIPDSSSAARLTGALVIRAVQETCAFREPEIFHHDSAGERRITGRQTEHKAYADRKLAPGYERGKQRLKTLLEAQNHAGQQ